MESNQIESARTLKICIIGSHEKCILFQKFLKQFILISINITPDFNVHIDTHQLSDNITNYVHYNFIFFISSSKQLNDTSLIHDIKQITTNFEHPRNHLFAIFDDSNNLGFDDDNILIYNDKTQNDACNELDDVLVDILGDKLFNLCKISISTSMIWKTIFDDGIKNLDSDTIDFLVREFKIKKSSKLSNKELNHELKKCIRKIDIDEKLDYCGFTDFYSDIRQYFKSMYQKKIITQNYIYIISQLNINYSETTLDSIQTFLDEIHNISFLKDESHQHLITQVQQIIIDKLTSIFKTYTNVTKKYNCIELAKYQKFLSKIKSICVPYNLDKITNIINEELVMINKAMLTYSQSEIEKSVDLDKIIMLLECFDHNSDQISDLFDKIKSNTQIYSQNIENTEKWLKIINKSLELGVNQKSVAQLIENIIISKITFYGDPVNSKTINGLYPQCLQIFLLSNLDKDFIFKKIYMYLTYSIRYSGKNIIDHIKNVDQYIYQNMLKIENRLLELYLVSECNDTRIIETFNEHPPDNETNNVITKKKYRSNG